MTVPDPPVTRLTEENARLWARRFLDMLEAVALITIILDREGRILFANSFLLQLTGWNAEELAGQKWMEYFIPAEMRPTLQRVFDEAVSGENPLANYENEILTRRGERRMIRWSNSWLRDAEGRIEGTASIGEDITERKRAEERVRAYEWRLRSLAAELAGTEDRERKRLATVLHEGVAQSLALAKMEADAVNRHFLPADAAPTMHNLQQHLDLSISQIRQMMSDLSPPVYVFNEVGRALVWLADDFSKKHGIEIVVEDDLRPKPIEDGLKVLIISALRELLTNAIKHGKAARIDVTLRRTDGSVRMTVRDNGIGFDASRLGDYLESSGGFGLFNLRERLLYIGGSFGITSSPGAGTEAMVVIPLSD